MYSYKILQYELIFRYKKKEEKTFIVLVYF